MCQAITSSFFTLSSALNATKIIDVFFLKELKSIEYFFVRNFVLFVATACTFLPSPAAQDSGSKSLKGQTYSPSFNFKPFTHLRRHTQEMSVAVYVIICSRSPFLRKSLQTCSACWDFKARAVSMECSESATAAMSRNCCNDWSPWMPMFTSKPEQTHTHPRTWKY